MLPMTHSTRSKPAPTEEGNSRFSAAWWSSLIVVAVLGVTFAASRRGSERDVRQPAVLSARAPRVSQERCAGCHSDITDAFHLAPHSRTLHRATDADVVEKFAGRSFRRDDPPVEYRYEVRNGQLLVSSPSYGRALPIEWILGSGTHAQTPLITWTDKDGNISGIEHSVSWYPPDVLGETLDMATLESAVGMFVHGQYRDAAEVANCFGCHSTYVPRDGTRIDVERIQPNVGCARCHWNVETHVAEMEAGQPASIERFSRLTPLESVERCGECHRRAGEIGENFSPDDPGIVRFASVGLTQSPCFVRQHDVILRTGEPARLDCTTCHDPHRPAIRDWRHHTQVCLTCHAADEGRSGALSAAHSPAVGCPIGSGEDNCLTCHMPKVAANEHLEFTDHWIRVREPREE